MKSPKSIEELGEYIDKAVGLYVAEAHEAAFQALERAFVANSAVTQRPSTTRRANSKPKGGTKRRSAQQLAELKVRLAELVRAKPGESMVTFSTELGIPVRELQRPMSMLKSEGLVRTVGRRQLTRYFPSVDTVKTTSS